MGVHEDTVYLFAGQNQTNDKCKDPNVLPNINKSELAGMMEAIEEYLRSCHDIVRVPLAYVSEDHNSPDIWCLSHVCNF